MRVETKMAFAAAFNGTALTPEFMDEANLKGIVLGELEDWFAYNPEESAPFDQECVLEDVSSATHYQILGVLADIGYRMLPGSDMLLIEPKLWHAFIEANTEEFMKEREADE